VSETEGPTPRNGDRINRRDIPDALTRAPFTYADGATQVFKRDGRTTYIENGSPTSGEWGLNDQGQFWSFWPPTYRAAYDVFWITEAGTVIGVRFVELGRDATSDGRYGPQHDLTVE
jgi:hypothetical protein